MRHRLAASAGSQYKGLRKTLRRRISALEAKVAQKVDGSSTNILDSVRNNGVADDEEMEQHMRQLEWLKAAARDGPDAARPIDATIAIAVSVYAGLSVSCAAGRRALHFTYSFKKKRRFLFLTH